MEVRGQLHAPGALLPSKEPWYPLDRRLVCKGRLYSNKMVAARNLYLIFGFIAATNEQLELGLWNVAWSTMLNIATNYLQINSCKLQWWENLMMTIISYSNLYLQLQAVKCSDHEYQHSSPWIKLFIIVGLVMYKFTLPKLNIINTRLTGLKCVQYESRLFEFYLEVLFNNFISVTNACVNQERDLHCWNYNGIILPLIYRRQCLRYRSDFRVWAVRFLKSFQRLCQNNSHRTHAQIFSCIFRT
jgi:hypothetical protein